MAYLLIFAIANGLVSGMAIFLVAAGLTIIFGLLKVLNFAHGAFFMVGAYLSYSILASLAGDPPSLAAYLLAALGSGLALGSIGLVVDKLVLSRLRGVDEAYMLVATFALLMAVSGIVTLIWGRTYYSVQAPESLAGAVEIGSFVIPTFSLFIVGVGLAIFVTLDLVMQRSWMGKILQSVASDPWMIRLLGFKVTAIFAIAVFVAFFLAGVAGGLLVSNQSVSPQLGDSYLMRAFIAVIIGGLGRIRGAFAASLLLGLLESLSAVVIPNLPGLSIYVAMILILIAQPHGLAAGRAAPDEEIRSENTLRTDSVGRTTAIGGILFAILMATPLWAGQGVLFVVGIAITQALLALSWNLLFGTAGVVAFGHAAYYAIGAYGVGYLIRDVPDIGFIPSLFGVTIIGAIFAALVGRLLIGRTSGIYFAIATLAICQVCYIVIGYIPALGRDDGLASIPRPVLNLIVTRLDLTSSSAYFWFMTIVAAIVVGLLWCFTAGKYGRILRSIRQDSKRASFSGVDVRRHERLAFILSGAVATVAGGLSAPWTQIVTPEIANVAHTTAPVLSALLGGAGSFWGPVVGAGAFSAIAYATRSFAGLSELLTGGILLVIVLLLPTGLLGLSRSNRIIGPKGRALKPACAQ